MVGQNKPVLALLINYQVLGYDAYFDKPASSLNTNGFWQAFFLSIRFNTRKAEIGTVLNEYM